MLQGNIEKLFIVFFTINKVKKNVVWRSRITIFQSPIIIRFYSQFLTTSFDFLFCLSILILLNSRIFFFFFDKEHLLHKYADTCFYLIKPLSIWAHFFFLFLVGENKQKQFELLTAILFFQSETSFNCPMRRLLSSSHRKFAFRSYNRVQSNVQCEK